MKERYVQASIFEDDDFQSDILTESGEYYLEESKCGGKYVYTVYNDDGTYIDSWTEDLDYSDLPVSQFRRSSCYRKFLNAIPESKKAIGGNRYGSFTPSYSYGYFDYSRPKGTKGYLEKLNKSDTLVIHCKDATTEMLCQIYEGKGWDVLRDGSIDKTELHELLKSHDRIVCLGHGTSGGLINRQGWGMVIGAEEAKYLKDKKLFIIWCNASDYAKHYGLHGVITGNMPSDYHEASWVGYHVGEKYMDDNITYWSKCMADVVEEAFDNPDAAAAKARKEYADVYLDPNRGWTEDELGITKYNYDRTTSV